MKKKGQNDKFSLKKMKIRKGDLSGKPWVSTFKINNRSNGSNTRKGDLSGKPWVSIRAQQSIGLSFGVIFSIILIIFFLLIAFIAIRAFIGTKDCTQVGIFIGDFEDEVTNIWNSQDVSTSFKRSLPTKIDYVCFADLSKSKKGEFEDVYKEISIYKGAQATMFFYPKNVACKTTYVTVEHLDIPKIITSDNPYCIPVENGVIKIKLEKEFNERLVRVS